MAKDENFTTSSNREYKASAFTTYFSIPEHAADLYRALENNCDIQPGDIVFTTLEGVLFMARKNDLAFTVQKKILVIGEHQSTLNLNMPLRSAIYYGRTMERLIPPKDIYKTKQIPIPTPEFYVFYNGTKAQPAERILRLSDAYLEKTDTPMLELTVKVININPSVRHPLVQNCQSVYEYSSFIQKIRHYLDQKLDRSKAIKTAMKDCLADGIMVDFIHTHGSEVINMLFTEFNLEDALEVRGEERYEDGLADGKAAGLVEGKAAGLVEGKAAGLVEGKASEIQIIRRISSSGMPLSGISKLLGLEEAYLSAIISLSQQYPDASDAEIASRLLASRSK